MMGGPERARDRDAARVNVYRNLFFDVLAQAKGLVKQLVDKGQEIADAERDNPNLVVAGVTVTVMAVVFLFWLLGVWTVDNTVLRPTTEYLLNMFAAASGAWRTAALYLLPLAFLSIDLPIGMKLPKVRGTPSAPVWMLIAVTWTAAMPAFAFAAYVAGAGMPSTPDAWWQVVGLCSLAFAAHASLVFGGSLVENGFNSLVFLMTRGRGRAAERAVAAEFIRTVEDAGARFEAWKESVRVYNRDHVTDALVVPGLPEDLVMLRAIMKQLLAGQPIVVGEPTQS